jgi:hypothetical protein
MRTPHAASPGLERLHGQSWRPGPARLTQAGVLQLQRSIGNRAVNRLLAPQSNPAPVQRQENNTGLPDGLKAGIENASGLSLDSVKVHYNSSRPAGLRALAYAQGSDIHLGPGQEKHLAHEAWHTVQQMQGRVRPTARAGTTLVNDDRGLENEASAMGARAAGREKAPGARPGAMKAGRPSGQVVQMIIEDDPAEEYIEMDHWGHRRLQNPGEAIRTDSMSSCVTIAIYNENNDAILAHFGSSQTLVNPLVDVKNGLTAIKNKIETLGGTWTGYVFTGVKEHGISEKRVTMIQQKLGFIQRGAINSGVKLTLNSNNNIVVTWEAPRKIAFLDF